MWPDGGWLVLDRAVEVEAATMVETFPAGAGKHVQSHEIATLDLYHGWFGTVVTAPAVVAFADLIEDLRAPVDAEELREELADGPGSRAIAELIDRGFVHVLTRPTLDDDALADARQRWLARQPRARNTRPSPIRLPWPGVDRVPVGASVELEGSWDAITEGAARQCIDWACNSRVGGVRLRATPGASSTNLDGIERALAKLEQEIGDFETVGFPTDDCIAGVVAPDLEMSPDPVSVALRSRHLRRRVAELRALEEMIGPPPSSAADALLVDPDTDLVGSDLSLLRLHAGAVVVDVCCGAGRTARRLAPHAGRVIGIERSSLAIAIGRAIDDAEGVANVELRCGLAQRLPLPDEFADAVVCDWSFNLFLTLGIADSALAEMVRVLKPGGRLAVMQVLSLFRFEDLSAARVYGADTGINIVRGIDEAFARTPLAIVLTKFWLNQNRTGGHPVRWFRRAHVPRLVDPVRDTLVEPGRRGMLCYTIVAEKPHTISP